ncbi:MAG TPA: DUF4124 domain-containing protein [Burkholderiales bacterium]|nr:DUF4124 domain-containing protein [Burkholderiales bacterium]
MKIPKILLAMLIAAPALAETCKYVDNDGKTTYSDIPVPGANRVSCLGAPPPTSRSAAARQSEEKSPEAPDRTSGQDNARRSELQGRLAAEEAKLAEAKRILSEQEAQRSGDERNYQRVLDRLKPYQDAVIQLEQTVGALKQELAGMR